MRDYTKIKAWKLADDLTVMIYEQTKLFPREELYGLTSQVRRAAASVAANIVEGSARASQRDYLHFLQMARGSLAETHYFIHLARRLGYLFVANAEQLTGQANQTFACLHGLMQCVESEAAKPSSHKSSARVAAGAAVLLLGVFGHIVASTRVFLPL